MSPGSTAGIRGCAARRIARVLQVECGEFLRLSSDCNKRFQFDPVLQSPGKRRQHGEVSEARLRRHCEHQEQASRQGIDQRANGRQEAQDRGLAQRVILLLNFVKKQEECPSTSPIPR